MTQAANSHRFQQATSTSKSAMPYIQLFPLIANHKLDKYSLLFQVRCTCYGDCLIAPMTWTREGHETQTQCSCCGLV